jgi:F-type H+-transporting ATPase subunit b
MEQGGTQKGEAISSSHGQEGGGEAQESGHGEEGKKGALIDLLYRIINFTAMVIILVWAIKKSGLSRSLSGRIDEIKQLLEKLSSEQREWEKNFAEIESRLKEFESEKEKILEQFRQEGIEERERIIQEAKEKAKRIIEQAEKSVEHELESAKEKLRKELVELAAQRAQEIISKVITEKDQENLVNEFIQKVERIH